MAKGSGGNQKIDGKVNVKLADIHTAAKSLAGPHDYSKGGYPAHDSLHINTKVSKSAKLKDKD